MHVNIIYSNYKGYKGSFIYTGSIYIDQSNGKFSNLIFSNNQIHLRSRKYPSIERREIYEISTNSS